MLIRVKTLTGGTENIDIIDMSITIDNLKSLLEEKTGIEKKQMRLICSGQAMKDSAKLSEYKSQFQHLCFQPYLVI